MKTKTNRLIALLLSLVLTLGIMQGINLNLVYASSGDGTADNPYIVTDYDELRNLMLETAYNETRYITLGADITSNDNSNVYYLELGNYLQSVVLDLAGHTLTRKGITTDGALINLSCGSLTIKDSVGGGGINAEMTGTDDKAVIAVGSSVENTKLRIEGGSFTTSSTSCLKLMGGSTVIMDGTFTADYYALKHSYGSVEVRGGEFYVNNTTNGSAMYMSTNNGSFTVIRCTAYGSVYAAGAGSTSSRNLWDHLTDNATVTVDDVVQTQTDTDTTAFTGSKIVITGSTKISQVDILGVTVPKGGNSPVLSASTNTEGVKIIAVSWLDADQSRLTADSVFEDNKQYTVAVAIDCSHDSYTLSGTAPAATINDNSASVSTNKYTGIMIIKYTFTALPGPISAVDVSITAPEAGAKPAAPVSNTPNTRIYSYEWHKSGVIMGEDDVFNDTDSYYCVVLVYPNDGYEFTADAAATVNGKAATINSQASDYINMYYEFSGKEIEYISAVDVSITAPEAGAKPAAPVSNTPNTRVSRYEWHNAGGIMGEDDVFNDTDSYYCVVLVYPNDGYEFTADAAATVNGKAATINTQAKDYINMYYDFSSAKPSETIYKIDMTVVPPAAGGHPVAPVCNTPNTTIVFYTWGISDSSSTQITSDYTFKDGEKYYCVFNLVPDTGYKFSTDLEYVLNGQTIPIGKVEEDFFGISCSFSLVDESTIIKSADVKVDVPIEGNTPAAPVVNTENVTISDYRWQLGADTLASDYTFEADKTYTCFVTLKPADGYTFDEDLKPVLNGNIANINNHAEDYVSFWYDFTAADKNTITSASVTITPPAAGEYPADAVCSTENVKIEFTDWYDMTGGSTAIDSSTAFEAGKTYRAQICLRPTSSDWKFSDYITVTANGETPSGITQKAESLYYFYCDFTIIDPYAISVVEAALTPPAAGEYPADAVCNTEHVEIGTTTWYDMTDGKTAIDSSTAFEAGKTYGVTIVFVADNKAGYKLTDDAVAMINGKDDGTVIIQNDIIIQIEYSFTVPADETLMIGDVNMDGQISANDSANVLTKALNSSYVLGCEEAYPSRYMEIADVTGDNSITSADAAAILQKTLDNTFVFPRLVA